MATEPMLMIVTLWKKRAHALVTLSSRRIPNSTALLQRAGKHGAVGVTLIELIIAMAILSILMSGILPLSYMTYKRSREIELRQNLRIVRNALDEYKKQVDEGKIPKTNEDSGYPPNLDILVEGVESTDAVPVTYKFLRRIPRDPMTDNGEWGLRAYADEPGSDIWGGQDVYDIYSQSDEQALDGTYYRDW